MVDKHRCRLATTSYHTLEHQHIYIQAILSFAVIKITKMKCIENNGEMENLKCNICSLNPESQNPIGHK